MMNWILAAVTLLLIPSVGTYDDVHCASPQYLERGKRGIVKCQFPEVYYGIFWYNTTDYLHSEPIVYMKIPNEIGGKGYDSNEYNISSNGSLVINKVSLQDDRNFTAVVLDSPRDEFSPNNIQVIVTVKPFQMQPHIDGCNTDEQLCFKKMNGSSELSCSVTDARPYIDINWYTKTISTDNPLRSVKNVTFENSLYTTLAKTTYIPNINENVVYVCKSVSQPLLLTNEYSLVLVQNVSKKFEKIEPTTVYAEHSTSIELPCTDQPTLYLSWRKTGPNNHTEDLISIVSADNSSFSKVHSSSYSLTSQRSLHISEVDVTDEGLYICIFGDGISEDVKKFSLQAYVIPDPKNPIVEGCNHDGYCSLTVPKTGELKCSLKGIRPKVKLRWETVKDNPKFRVDFSTISHKVEENGLNYDIILTSNFSIQDSSSGWISIRCRAFDFGDIPFDLSRDVYLLPLKEESEKAVTPSEGTVYENNGWKIAVPVSLLIGIAVAVVAYFGRNKLFKRNRRPDNTIDEEMAILQKPDDEKVRKFKEELSTTYKSSCERFRPLPYDKAVEYSLSKIFVEGEIEYLETEHHEEFGKLNHWQKLKSHNQFLNLSLQNNAKIILEGEPGYGKTTLGYQFAYDWSNKNQDSPLINVDVYILLRLRYLKNISSIPDAIKKFLLPENTLLTAKDVANILYYSESVVIYLDGFNRFSDNKKDQADLMNEVYSNNISSKCKVIVTTKPFCLPNGHADKAKRMRLTGFGESTWKNYLENCIAQKYRRRSSDEIVQILRKNSLLGDLCQVPLFFVLFAHIESRDNFQRGDLKTLTDFFKILMECFHRKMYHGKPEEHTALSKVAFNGLIHDEKGLNWEKGDISHQLGESLYKEYCDIGMLVERQFCSHNRRRKQAHSSKYETRVRFYHDIFCEWYAAHWLVKVAKTGSQEKRKKYFDKINPMDHQYLYRFACGMDSIAAKEIINYIQKLRDGEKFSILCILEQVQNFEEVKDTIENICLSPVIINAHDSLFLQRSTIQLLQFASNKGINIELVWLGKTNGELDLPKESLEFSSGLLLPKLATLRELYIRDPGRKFSKADFLGFLKYASLSASLKTLRFRACLLPFLQPEDLDSEKNVPGQKEKEVQWEIPDREWYRLDIESGIWKHKEEGMSQEYYDKLERAFDESQLADREAECPPSEVNDCASGSA